MRFLALILLAGAFLRHGTANWLAEGSSMSAAAWFYVLGGAWEAVLCAVILLMVYGYHRTIWRVMAATALVIGILEGAQMSVCRLAITDIRAVPAGVNLCDYATGLPVGAVMLTLYLLFICYELGRTLFLRT
ncbi:MAG: hypothetical protein WC700_20140 [Gemmatimonadaceae bacterium]|jgi:hypothetical protein